MREAMSEGANPPRRWQVSRPLWAWTGAALLVVMALTLFLSARQLTQVTDEGDHIFSGYEYWKHGDFARNPEHPPLVKLLAALPLLALHPVEPAWAQHVGQNKNQDFRDAEAFLYQGNIAADTMLLRARMMAMLFPLALGALVFFAASEMFGRATGLCVLALYVFEPMLLANGALVMTDTAISCCLFAAVYAFYRYLQQPSWQRLALCGLAVGMTVAAKHSGAIALPLLALLALVDLARQAFEARDWQAVRARAPQLLVALCAFTAMTYVFLWACYGFHFAARSAAVPLMTLGMPSPQNHSLQHGLLGMLYRHHLLPEGYLYGFADVLGISTRAPMFVFGHLYPTGRWFFFPAMLVYKSSLALLALLLLAPFARLEWRSRKMLFLALPAAIYFGVSVYSMLNIGARHILPIYPFCLVIAGAAGVALAERGRWGRWALAAVLLFTAVSSLHAFPNYLAYANEAFGGPSHNYLLGAGSNSDYAQGLKQVKAYLDQHPAQECWIAPTFWAADPAFYGIPCKPLVVGQYPINAGQPITPPPPVISGTVIVSATNLDDGAGGPGALNPYEIFREQAPDAVIGNIMMVYHGTFAVPLIAAQAEDTLASSLMRAGDPANAVLHAQKAYELAPNFPRVNNMLGQCLNAAGRKDEAFAAFARARDLTAAVHF